MMGKVKVVKRKVAQQGHGLLWLSSEKLQGRGVYVYIEF